MRSFFIAAQIIFLLYLIGQGKHHDVVRGNKRCKGNLVIGEGLQKVFRIEADHVVGHDRAAYPGDHKGVEERVDMTAGHDKKIAYRQN